MGTISLDISVLVIQTVPIMKLNPFPPLLFGLTLVVTGVFGHEPSYIAAAIVLIGLSLAISTGKPS